MPVVALTYSTADLTGAFDYSTESALVVRLTEAATTSWTLDASTVDVHWDRDTWLEAGRPTNASEPLGTIQLQSTHGDEAFVSPHAQAKAAAFPGSLDVVTAAGQAMTLRGEAVQTTLRSNPTGHRVTAAAADYPPLQVRYAVASDLIQGEAGEANVTLTGNFSIHVWSMNVTVRHAHGESTFQSGTWTQGIGPDPDATPPHVRERHYQTLRLDVADGTLRIANHDGHTEWLAPHLNATGTGAAAFQEPDESDARQSAGPPNVPVAGNLTLETWAEPSDWPRLQATLRPDETGPTPLAADPETARQPPGSGPPAPAGPPIPYAWMAAIAIASAAGVLAARRMRSSTVADLEWALLSGRIRHARRLGSRLLRRNPGDENILFLYGTALLAMKDHDTIRRRVEPQAKKVPATRRAALAYILTASASAQGDLERARRWAADACQEPTLRKRLSQMGLIAGRKPNHPASAGYA